MRLGRINAAPPRQLPEASPRAIGDREEFQLVILPSPASSSDVPPATATVPATLRYVSERAYFYLADGVEASDEELAEAARAFDEEIYPKVTAALGREWSPGIDRDPHIAILHADLGQAVGGYFFGSDEYPRAVSPLSNQREMVYLDDSLLPVGSAAYRSALAHELQHLIHHYHDPDEETWVNEGLSEVAAGLVGGNSFQNAFLKEPDSQLTTWEQDRSNAVHYGASNLFFLYLLQRAGGTAAAADLVRQPADGIAGVEAFLAERGVAASFLELFGDWLVATYLDQDEGIYGYRDAETALDPSATLEGPAEGSDTVHQFAADYLKVSLPSGDAVFSFEGDPTVPVLANQPHSGSGQWWSGRGDAIDTTLTRELDLTGLTSASLTFWTWFDIERWYDYGYVEVSSDGGRSWQILPGRHTTSDDPLRQAYGPGYSGRSGGETPAWVEESIDLTPFAGRRVLLRFEYVTDDSLNAPGWAIDDIAVPELGLLDGAEEDGPWEAAGFQRLARPLPQRFLLRVIEQGQQTTVRDLPLDGANRAEIRLSGFGQGLETAVIVVAAASEGTTELAGYRYRLSVPAP